MNEMQIFENPIFGQLRTVEIDNETWFVGKDVATALKYSNPQKAIRDHVDNEDKTVNDSFTVNGTPVILINESGMYALIFGSKLEKAKEFKHWVTSEVLPQIRKTGGYIPVKEEDDDLTIMVKAHQILERTLEEKDNLIEEWRPKVETYDHVMSGEGTLSMNEAAKTVGVGEYNLFKFLRDQGVLCLRNLDNVPYERFLQNGYFTVIDTKCRDGKVHAVTRVTQKGIDYISKLLRNNNIPTHKDHFLRVV